MVFKERFTIASPREGEIAMSEHAADAMWHIDRRCTNCDAARQLAPGLIGEVAGRSSVIRQPRTEAEEHEGDLAAAPEADQVLRGTEPTQITEGISAHPLPGHTKGSVVYLADETYCFSGDSFYWSRTTNDLAVAESVTWYSITELAASLDRAASRVRLAWLLPGHGDRKQLPPEEFTRRIRDLADRTTCLTPQPIDFTALRW